MNVETNRVVQIEAATMPLLDFVPDATEPQAQAQCVGFFKPGPRNTISNAARRDGNAPQGLQRGALG